MEPTTRKLIDLLLVVLLLTPAIWRTASLLANEDGPFRVFKRFRRFARQLCDKRTEKRSWLYKIACRFARRFHLYQGLCCEWCNSIWISIPVWTAYLLFGIAVVYVLLPLTLSAGAIFIKFIIQNLECLLSKRDLEVKLLKEQLAQVQAQMAALQPLALPMKPEER